MNNALRVTGLTHFWAGKPALQEVGFSLERGRFCALLGPNGAGKSTLISVLTGLVRPPRDRVWIGGVDIARKPVAALRQIGVVYQQPTLDLDLTVQQNMEYFAALQGLGGKAARLRIGAALARLEMAERAAEPLRALNGGHRRRMEIARALIHAPAVLLLDEPTVGLDLPARRAIVDHVHDLATEGVSVLWTTHLPDEIRPADQMVLLDRGRVAAAGTVSDLTGGQPLADWVMAKTGGPCN